MRVSILPFGADETVFYPPLELSAAHLDRPQIVYVGPLTERQGVHILLDAMRLLMRRGVDAELYVIERPDPGASLNFGAGRQDGGEYLRSLRAMNGTNARFAPYLGSDQVANAMRSAVAVCCPSIGDEGFGLCNVEAMACGVPVAASCVGGIPDVFAEGGGLLVPPSDPVALANAIERLMGKTGLSRILRGEGYENFLRNYCWPRIAAAYMELLDALPYSAPIRREALP